MQEACDSAGVALATVFQQRTGSGAAHVRDLLRSGALGRPLVAQCETLWFRGADYYAVDWRGRWDSEGGGTTLGHGIHQMDLLAHLLGDWQEISAQTWRLDRDTEMDDLSTATILFRSGVVATAVSSTLSPRETSHVRVDCERATVEVEHLYGHSGPDWRITPAPGVPAEEAAGWALPEEDEPSGHVPLVRATYRALREGTVLPDVASSARRPLEIVTAIYASAHSGGRRVTADELRETGVLSTGLERLGPRPSHRAARCDDGLVTPNPTPRRPDVTTLDLIGGVEPLTITLHDYDETWPVLYRDHEQRIREALSGTDVLVEHIGSTSVPGLAAKPIIDVVVGVDDITAEEDYLDGLLAAGYVLRVREPRHRLVRTPGRDVHVHVYEKDDPSVHEYLLLRDHLRADAADRELYESTKRSLMSTRWDDMNSYADAKTDVIVAIKDRARAARG